MGGCRGKLGRPRCRPRWDTHLNSRSLLNWNSSLAATAAGSVKKCTNGQTKTIWLLFSGSLNYTERTGVRGNVHNLLTSYLSNRFQYTVNREERVSSGLLPISVGVPQGSVLGPFLVLVYINDLPNLCESKTVLYADDYVFSKTQK